MTVRETDMSIFLDSNILLYALGDDEAKRLVAVELLAAWPTTSTQVINECSHVLRRKLKTPPVQVAEEMESVIDAVQLVDVGLHEIRSG